MTWYCQICIIGINKFRCWYIVSGQVTPNWSGSQKWFCDLDTQNSSNSKTQAQSLNKWITAFSPQVYDESTSSWNANYLVFYCFQNTNLRCNIGSETKRFSESTHNTSLQLSIFIQSYPQLKNCQRNHVEPWPPKGSKNCHKREPQTHRLPWEEEQLQTAGADSTSDKLSQQQGFPPPVLRTWRKQRNVWVL